MRVIALIAVYNEERYIAACLEHLFRHGAEAYLIDNDSTDQTVAIAQRYLGRGLIAIENMPRNNMHALRFNLYRAEELAATLDADWFIHMDVDEFRLPPRSSQTLAQALQRAQAAGYNAVNFDEFVFIPTQEAPNHEHADFQQTMRWYYPFRPDPMHRLNAWQRQPQRVDLASSGGHKVKFDGLKMYPTHFKMRHYHFLSVGHAIARLVGRRFDPIEVARGWHVWRAKLRPEMIRLPPQRTLSRYRGDDRLSLRHARKQQYLGDLVAEYEAKHGAAEAGS